MRELAAAVAFLILLAFGIWAWFAGPCELYAFSKAGEVPARCVMR
ncbi:hypothetical protein [Plantactinospora sp. WMMB782]